MTDEQKDVFQQWLEAQQQMWQGFMQGGDDANSEAKSHPHHRWAETMVKQTQLFNEFGQQILDALNSGECSSSANNSTDNASANHSRAKDYEALIKQFTEHFQSVTQVHNFNQWQIPESIQDFLSTLDQHQASGQFPFFLQAFSQRQQHYSEQVEHLTTSWQAFQKAWQSFSGQQQQIQQAASTAFSRDIEEDKPESLDALYQLWINNYEAALETQSETSEYQRAYGQLFNCALHLRTLLSQFAQDDYRQMGLVPLNDYQALLKQHHQLRKEQRQTNKALKQIESRLQLLEQQLLEQQLRDSVNKDAE